MSHTLVMLSESLLACFLFLFLFFPFFFLFFQVRTLHEGVTASRAANQLEDLSSSAQVGKGGRSSKSGIVATVFGVS